MKCLVHGWSTLVTTTVSSLLLSLIVFGVLAVADPIVRAPPPDTTMRLTDPFQSIVWLFSVNFLVNMLCYSALLVAFAGSRNIFPRLGIISTSGARFLAVVVSAVAAISLIGAAVDFYLVTQPRYLNNIYDFTGRDISGTYRVIVLDLVNWASALFIIFLSVVAASFAFLRLRVTMSAAIGLSFVSINIVMWVLTGVFGENVAILTMVFGVLTAPFAVAALLRWYASDRPLAFRSSLESEKSP